MAEAKKKTTKPKTAAKPKAPAKTKAKPKTAKPKAASKKKSAASRPPFNLLKHGAKAAAAAKETIHRQGKGLPYESGAPASTISKRMIIPIPELVLQNILKVRGFISGTVVHIIGADGVGKTTSFFTFAGWFATYNAPSLYIETENKLITEQRAKAALSESRELADMLFPTVTVQQAFNMQDMLDTLLEWIKTVRDPASPSYVPLHIPILLGVDSWSKLLSPTENLNVKYMQGKLDAKGEKKRKAVGGGSNFEIAKGTHSICRQLPAILASGNVCAVFYQHQNDSVDMGGGGAQPLFISPEASNKVNRTSNAGNGFNQNAMFQFVLTKYKQEKASRDSKMVKLGQHINMMCVKNSIKPPAGDYFTIRWIPEDETDAFQSKALDFYAAFTDLMVKTKALAVTQPTTRTVVCREVSDETLSLQQFHKLVHSNPELVERIAKQLGIWGYEEGDSAQIIPDMVPGIDELLAGIPQNIEEKEMLDAGVGDVAIPTGVSPFDPKPSDQSDKLKADEKPIEGGAQPLG